MSNKVLLDTDIGTDIDDAICLAYLLAHPECELLGITTVTGQPVKRAMLASAMCKVANKNIPIYPGGGNCLIVPPVQLSCLQEDALLQWEHDKEFPIGEAVFFMRDMIRKYPGEVTLLAVGPMTNIALLFRIDPEIPSLLKELVLLCGKFNNTMDGGRPTECNARLDPHATAIVYKTPVCMHRSIGTELYGKVQMHRNDVPLHFTADILRPVLDFSIYYHEKQKRDFITFADPLAAACIFNKNLLKYDKGFVEVELLSEKLKGFTHWTANEGGKHEIAVEVDSEGFFKHYFDVVNSFICF